MEKERLTGTLSRPNRPLVNHLAEAGFDEGTIHSTLPWSNRLEADARKWLMRGGLAAPRHLTKADAARLFAHEFGAVRSAHAFPAEGGDQ